MTVIVGIPINQHSGYMLEKFLSNQEEIQEKSQYTLKLVFSTEDREFIPKLEDHLINTSLDYAILPFEVEKPEWTKDRIWALTQAREKIRKYCTLHNLSGLIFLDADMTFDPGIVNILMNKACEGYNIVYKYYLLKNGRVTFNGFGGTFISRSIFQNIPFRCYESRNNKWVIDEGFFFEMDLLRRNARIFLGILCFSVHYSIDGSTGTLEKRPLSRLEKVKYFPPLRKFISRFSEKPLIMSRFVKIRYFLGNHVW